MLVIAGSLTDKTRAKRLAYLYLNFSVLIELLTFVKTYSQSKEYFSWMTNRLCSKSPRFFMTRIRFTQPVEISLILINSFRNLWSVYFGLN